jgi:hypothetical protein
VGWSVFFTMLSIRDVVKFGLIVGLCGILADSAIAHALTWENDPFWTYWITKTFLIGTIFSLGTAWFGIGRVVGAIFSFVTALVLSIYYWTFSPIGLPNEPKWLDFNHAWVTGIPVHFAVIYLGYLTAFWLWRANRTMTKAPASAAPVNRALVTGIGAVLLMGILSSLVLGQFVGVTWFVTRILVVYPILLFFTAYVPRSGAATLGATLIASFALADYSHYLSPLRLPGQWRLFHIFDPVTVPYWLNYHELWFRQFPVYFVVMFIALWLTLSRPAAPRKE